MVPARQSNRSGSWISAGLTGAWMALALAVATVVLFTAPAVGLLAEFVHGDSPDATVLTQSAEQIRRYTVGVESAITVDPSGANGLDSAALEHLLDVRTIVRFAGLLASALGALLLVTAIGAFRSKAIARALGRSLRWAGVGVGALVALAGVTVAVGFDWFFVTFHQVLFADGTWTFSSDSLLIRTFPEPFWVAGAVSWLAVVVVLAAVMLFAGAVGRRDSALPPGGDTLGS